MIMNMMDRPATREEFERKLNLLHRRIAEGKAHFHRGLTHTLDGIERVRYLPNGRIDFLSVNESARLTANSMAQFSEESFKDYLGETQEYDQNC